MSGNGKRPKGIAIRSREELVGIAKAGRLAGRLRRRLGNLAKPGISTLDLNRFAERYMREHGALPAQKGYHGYPYAICTAVNDCVCHGMPDGRRLKEGDLVTLDFVVELDGWMADTAWTYSVGSVSEAADRLRRAAYRATMSGIAAAAPGKRIGDIAAAVCDAAGAYGVVSQFGGHGIGRAMHEPPEVPHVGEAGTGTLLREGMVITIEPMLTEKESEVYIAEDGWSVMTMDGGWAAQFEHTVAIVPEGPLILTL